MPTATSAPTSRWACRCGPMRMADFPGPLAGVLVGLERCETPYLVTVPCDTPNFPLDLVDRLAQALVHEDADIAMAATRENGELHGAAGVLPAEGRRCWRAWSSTCTKASARSTAGPRCTAWPPWCSTTLGVRQRQHHRRAAASAALTTVGAGPPQAGCAPAGGSERSERGGPQSVAQHAHLDALQPLHVTRPGAGVARRHDRQRAVLRRQRRAIALVANHHLGTGHGVGQLGP